MAYPPPAAPVEVEIPPFGEQLDRRMPCLDLPPAVYAPDELRIELGDGIVLMGLPGALERQGFDQDFPSRKACCQIRHQWLQIRLEQIHEQPLGDHKRRRGDGNQIQPLPVQHRATDGVTTL